MSYNPVFDGARPQAIAYVASPADVATAIAFGRDHNAALAIRAGGHCYGGWSTGSGLVIDVSLLSEVAFDPSAMTVTAGAGTRLIDFYAGMAPHGVAVPGGSCPTVGLAGLTLGGGVGVLSRKLGLTCDNLLEADMVLATGAQVTANASSHSDLFWALRGAGGGNFGVVTRLGFGVHEIGELALFTLVWPWESAARVVASWQDFVPSAVDELWSNCLLFPTQSTPSGLGPVARVTGVYVGSQSALESELAPFLQAIGAQPFTRFFGSAGYLDTMLIEAGCDGDTVAECHLPTANPAGIEQRQPFSAKSDIVTSRVPQAGIATLLAAVEARHTSPVLSGGGVSLDAAGGAMSRVRPDATAFVHRDAMFVAQYSSTWQTGASPSLLAANRQWLEATWRSMRPFVSGQAYQNYADPALPGWQQAYYGSNLARLEAVKAAYDPANVFKFAQSIPLE